MSKKDFNPYRDMLDIPSLTDENPTDYQLLGIDDFESDCDKVAAAYEKRSQRIAELYQLVTEMSGKIDAARDRICDSKAKEEYDLNLMRTGRAGVAHLGKSGFSALLSSFVLSIIVVIVSTFYIYPMVVAVPVENIGDSVTTLPGYKGDETKKEIDILKTKQEDISTMDVNFNMPIDVDADSTVDFLDIPAAGIPGEETSVDDLPAGDAPLTEQEPAPSEDSALPEQPADEELTIPELPAEEDPSVEEPATPEAPAVPESPAVEEPATDEAPAVPELPSVEEPATDEEPAVPELPAVEEPATDEPSAAEKAEASFDSAVPENSSISAIRSNSDTPAVPKISDYGNTGIPELPSLEDITVSEPPGAPDPPAVPELSASDAPESSVALNNSIKKSPLIAKSPDVEPFNETAASQKSLVPTSGAVLEDVDKLDRFVQLGRQARTDADFAQLLLSARQTAEELMKEKMFQEAQQIADVVYSACARSADKVYRSEAYRLKDHVSKRAAWWESVCSAQEKMESNGTVSPTDAALVAQWKIEIENDWDNGLKYLTLSENEQIRTAAQTEIAVNQEDVRSVLNVANSWWNLAQYPVPMQKQFRAHASTWYAKALPSIADKQIRTLVEKRISMVVGSRQ